MEPGREVIRRDRKLANQPNKEKLMCDQRKPAGLTSGKEHQKGAVQPQRSGQTILVREPEPHLHNPELNSSEKTEKLIKKLMGSTNNQTCSF